MKAMEEKKDSDKKFDYEEVDMHSRNVTDITPLINVIKSNPSVKRVNLSDNYVTKLPSDLSMLKEVYEINLIDNDLNPFEQAVLALKTMPNLTSLHLNLHEEAQVDFVIRHLPHLKYLNGELIDREELQNETSREDQEEATNKSKTLESIRQIKEEEEEDEETTEKHISKIEESKGEHHARHSSIYSESCQEILNYSDSEEISLKPQDLETVALIFDKIRNMHRKNKLSNDKQMAAEFDKHLKS